MAIDNIDIDEAARFIELLTGSADTPVTFQTFHDVDKNNNKKAARIIHGTLAENRATLSRLNQEGVGVFIMMNEGDGQGRAAANVTRIRSVFVDCDTPDKDPLGSIDKARFDPDVIVESSPGKFHASRLVGGVPLDKELFGGLQLTFAGMVHGDPAVHDVCRVLRVPGFLHRKRDPFQTRIHRVRESGVRVTAYADFLAEFGLTEDGLRHTYANRNERGAANAKAKSKPTSSAPSALRKAVTDWESEFSVQMRDGQGRNNHATRLAGRCAATGLSLDASQAKIAAWNAGNMEPLDAGAVVDIVKRVWGKEAEKRSKFPMTEVGFAQRFAAAYGDHFKFLADAGLWMYWDGRTWCFDTGDMVAMEAIKATARYLLTEAANTSEDSKRQALIKFNRESERVKSVLGTLKISGSDPAFVSHSNQFDRDPFLIATDGAVLDLKTGGVTMHSRESMITNRLFVTYDAQADCPQWKTHIDKVTCGDRVLAGYLQRVLGYCLTGSVKEHKMFIFSGGGSNGKSTTLNIVERMMGGYSRRVPAVALMVQRRHGGGPSEDIARLKGCRLALTGEMTNGNQLNEGLVKDLVSDDSITARLMYKGNITFKPTHKIISATNILPTVAGTDDGIWRRLCVVPFGAKFEGEAKDTDMEAKLWAEAPGILNWLMEGCLEWQRVGLLEPKSVTDTTAEYRDELDVMGRFLRDACLIADGEYRLSAKTQAAAMYAAYKKYCGAFNLPTVSDTKFGRDLRKIFSKEKNGCNSYIGVTLRDEWKDAGAVILETTDSAVQEAADKAAFKARNEIYAKAANSSKYGGAGLTRRL